MTLEQQIQEDIKAAMKAKDPVALAATRAVKGEILLFKTAEGGNGEVTDSDVLKMIQKLIKQRKESAEQYNAAGRPELADNELAQVGATSIRDMGRVMGVATKVLAGQADGRTISSAVKSILG